MKSKIVLGVSGSIAAYKACEIVRGFDRAGVEVQVILTRNATHFVTPLALQTLSRRKVFIETFDLDDDKTIRHIELTREIEALVVAGRLAPAAAPASRVGFDATTETRARGEDSAGRWRAILGTEIPPAPDAVRPPILNTLTRLALTAAADGQIAVAGYDGRGPVTALTTAHC